MQSGHYALTAQLERRLPYGGAVLPPALLHPCFAHLTQPPDYIVTLLTEHAAADAGGSSSDTWC